MWQFWLDRNILKKRRSSIHAPSKSLTRNRYSNYGGACVNAEYSHEVGLRLVLNSLSSTAARYGRYITPLLSFSIDFYVRLFVVVNTGPNQVKDLAR